MARRNDAAYDITPKCCCGPMPAASFPWPRAPTTPRCTGSSRRARRHSASRASTSPSRLARTVRSDAFDDPHRHAISRGHRGLRRPGAAARNLDQRAHPPLYGGLHEFGHGHTVEAWQDGELVGGLYGVRLGGAFFGESMFHVARDASKVALVHLVARLRVGGFELLDTQYVTEHLPASARSKSPAAATASCWTRRSGAPLPTLRGCRSIVRSAARGRWRSSPGAGERRAPDAVLVAEDSAEQAAGPLRRRWRWRRRLELRLRRRRGALRLLLRRRGALLGGRRRRGFRRLGRRCV